ncbi:hypothetical protein [Microbacterium enclense]|uniref:hypothetical protein n=1 Tax=Microbacterium enclense TaxID=993073 RepID=UPI00342C6696
MSNTIERTHLTLDGSTYALAPLEDADDVRSQILRAVRAGGGFVIVTSDGGQQLSFFVSATTSVLIAVETVQLKAGTADGGDQVSSFESSGDYGGGDIPFDVI